MPVPEVLEGTVFCMSGFENLTPHREPHPASRTSPCVERISRLREPQSTVYSRRIYFLPVPEALEGTD